MTPERWHLVTGVFHAALECPPDQRESYLVSACRQDPSLRADVDALLAGDDRAGAAADPLVSGHAALSPGTVLGPYRIDALVGAGGMGEVYKARDTRLKRDVAIKVLPARESADPDRLQRFEREAHAMAALNHPNICAVFDIGMHDGAPFIVSELLEGETLRQVCADGPLSVRRALEYVVPVARGLAAAHIKGVVHRDLKPENVFITTEARVKILDFGLAKLIKVLAGEPSPEPAPSRSLTEVGLVVGTVGYMSPEQVRGLPTDSRSDIFSFGTLLFEMLAGRRPFHGDTAADIASAILREDPPALLPPIDASSELERIIRRCLEKAPSNRFQSADDLAFALEALTGTPPAAARAVDGARLRPVRLLPLATASLAVATVALAAAWFATPQSVDPGAHRFMPFATAAGAPDYAAWSPDGRSVAYQMPVNRRLQIFVRSLDSDTPAQITHGDGGFSPFWWPDAGRIGYLSAGKVWSVSRAGGAPALVQGEWANAAALSPDGQTLATWRTDMKQRRFSVWLATPPTAAPHEYAPAPFEVKGWFSPDSLQFSPDGTQLLLADFTDAGDTAVWLLPLGAGARLPHRIFPKIPGIGPQVEPAQPSWMPDSRRALMVFRTASAPKGGLWMTDTRTGASTPMSMGLTRQSNPSVSPDGSKVVFTSGGASHSLVDVPLNASPMRDATGSDEYSGSWVSGSPRYVYLTNKNGEEELRIRSETERWDRLIVARHAFGATSALSSPIASPDGERVAYDVWGAGGGASSIWISSVGGGAPTRLTPAGAAERAADWSPDGQSIVCHHEEGGVVGLAVVRVGTSDPPRVLAHDIVGTIPAWSPQGDWIAYRTIDALRLVSPDGARQRLLAPGGGTAMVWSRDGGTLYTPRRTPDRGLQIIAIDVATGAVRVVTSLGFDVTFGTPTLPGERFTLALDGNSFLATIVRTRSDLWILDNFTPRGGLLDWFRRRP